MSNILKRAEYEEEIRKYGCTYFAIAGILNTIIYDENLELCSETDKWLDEAFDCYRLETDYECSMIYAGSPPWKRTNIEERRKFWNWYLDEAINKADNLEIEHCNNIKSILSKNIDYSKFKIKKINNEELEKIMKDHQKWLNDEKNGIKASFENKDLRGKSMPSEDFSYISFDNALLEGCVFIGNYFTNSTFNNTNLIRTGFFNTTIENSTFYNTDFEESIINNCEFINCDFTNSNLEKALNLEKIDFINCIGIKNEVYKKLNEFKIN